MAYQIKDEPMHDTAITPALQMYAANKGTIFAKMVPKSNQQGDRLRRLCTDLVGVLDGASFLLLELKVLDCKLVKLEMPQYHSNFQRKRLGFPVARAYIRDPSLAYHEHQAMPTWPMQTLMSVNYPVPSQLPGRCPAVESHESP